MVRELIRLGLRTIALNVEPRNHMAIRVCERPGFTRCCASCEGQARRAREG